MEIYELKGDAPTKTITALLARVSAGEPLEVASELERIDPHTLLTKGSDMCVLIRVHGESMVDLIRSDDWVVVDRAREPCAGDVILANLDGEMTIKTFEARPSGLYLVPMNDSYRQRQLDETDVFSILGVVTMVIHPLV